MDRSREDRRRVLVVDDRFEMAEMLADALSEHGYGAAAVSTGREAIEKLVEERFDALITDLRMPVIDGLALLRISLELDPSRPVIIMTAYGTVDAAIESSRRGAYTYLLKPFKLETLLRALQDALNAQETG